MLVAGIEPEDAASAYRLGLFADEAPLPARNLSFSAGSGLAIDHPGFYAEAPLYPEPDDASGVADYASTEDSLAVLEAAGPWVRVTADDGNGRFRTG